MKSTRAAATAAAGRPLVLAVPKGRILDETVPLFERAGYPLGRIRDGSRRLVFDLPASSRAPALRVIVLRGGDVPVYVEHGAADVGVAGRDVLEEDARDVYQPVDLGIGRCRLVVAEPERAIRARGARPVDLAQLHVRIGTKYPHCTRRHLESRGEAAEIVVLSGSIELAPLVGLCDRIVDLVATGATLREHGLREVETVLEVTSRLIVNRASLKLRRGEVDEMVARLRPALPTPDRPGHRAAGRTGGRGR